MHAKFLISHHNSFFYSFYREKVNIGDVFFDKPLV
jgi:hypothetical protein